MLQRLIPRFVSRLSAVLAVLGVLGLGAAPAHASLPVPSALLAQVLEGVVNLNTASSAQLQLLPGVGPATAAKIIAYRERRSFKTITQLMRIKGIGRQRFAAIRPHLAVEGETTLHVAAP